MAKKEIRKDLVEFGSRSQVGLDRGPTGEEKMLGAYRGAASPVNVPLNRQDSKLERALSGFKPV